MTNKYHTRRGYEQLLINILFQKNGNLFSLSPDLKRWSDYQLLRAINSEIITAGCCPMDADELEMELQ